MAYSVGRRRGSYIPNGQDAAEITSHFDMVNGRRGSIRVDNLNLVRSYCVHFL